MAKGRGSGADNGPDGKMKAEGRGGGESPPNQVREQRWGLVGRERWCGQCGDRLMQVTMRTSGREGLGAPRRRARGREEERRQRPGSGSGCLSGLRASPLPTDPLSGQGSGQGHSQIRGYEPPCGVSAPAPQAGPSVSQAVPLKGSDQDIYAAPLEVGAGAEGGQGTPNVRPTATASPGRETVYLRSEARGSSGEIAS